MTTFRVLMIQMLLMIGFGSLGFAQGFEDYSFKDHTEVTPPGVLIQLMTIEPNIHIEAIAAKLRDVDDSRRISGWLWHLMHHEKSTVRKNTARVISSLASDLSTDDLFTLQKKMAEVRMTALLQNETELAKASQTAMADVSGVINERLRDHFRYMDQLDKAYMNQVYPKNFQNPDDESNTYSEDSAQERLILDFKCAFKEFETSKELEKTVQAHIESVRDIGRFLIREMKRGYGRSFGEEFLEKFKSELQPQETNEPNKPINEEDSVKKESSQIHPPYMDGIRLLDNYEAPQNEKSNVPSFNF